jgi:TatD DNase family protein
MFVDSHCHLTYEPMVSNLPKVIENCAKANVGTLLTIATNIESSIKCSEISQNYENIYSSIGIHPSEAHIAINNDDQIQTLYKLNNKNIGYGETGLDFFHSIKNKKRQIELFEKHIDFATKDNATVIVHTRNAEDETLNIIRSHLNKKDIRFLIHCFTGTMEFAKSLLDLGCYLSFSGIITFKNTTDLQNVVKFLPLRNLLIETDSPYLAPDPFRGKVNSPENVIYVARKISNLKGISLREVEATTFENFFSAFDINL